MGSHRSTTRLGPILICLALSLASSPVVAGGIPYTANNPGEVTGSSGSTKSKDAGLITVGLLIVGSALALTAYSYAEFEARRQTRRFRTRYARSGRAIEKDLRRGSGAQYAWVQAAWLGLDRREQRRFRCLLRRHRAKLVRHLERARSKREAHVDKLAGLLIELGRSSHDPRHICTLEATYLSGPASFERVISGTPSPALREFLKEYLELKPGFERAFYCVLKTKGSSLREAFALLGQASTRRRGLARLNRVLKDARARALRGPSCPSG